MRQIKHLLILNGSLIVLGFAAYQLLLNDEAKEALKNGINALALGAISTIEAVEEMRGVVVDDDQPLPNVVSTDAQWEALGL